MRLSCPTVLTAGTGGVSPCRAWGSAPHLSNQPISRASDRAPVSSWSQDGSAEDGGDNKKGAGDRAFLCARGVPQTLEVPVWEKMYL